MNKLDQSELDVILSVRNENLPGLSSTLLLSNQLYLLVSDRLLEQYYGQAAASIKEQSRRGTQLEDFAKLPFLLITPPNKLGTIIANCFEEAGIIPHVYLSTINMRMSCALFFSRSLRRIFHHHASVQASTGAGSRCQRIPGSLQTESGFP